MSIITDIIDDGLIASEKSEDHYRDWRTKVSRDIDSHALRLKDISLSELYDACVEGGRGRREAGHPLFDSDDFVGSAELQFMTSKYFHGGTLEGYDLVPTIDGALCTEVEGKVDGPEKMVGWGGVGNQFQVVPEGGAYPQMGIDPSETLAPGVKKRGGIISASEEIFRHDSGELLRRLQDIGADFAKNRELRILNCVLGITSTYNRDTSGAQATYGDTHTNGTFDNLVGSNALVDWTDIDAAMQVLLAITDPSTGFPIRIDPTNFAIVVPPALGATASHIVNAMQIRTNTDTAAQTRLVSGNGLGFVPQVVTGQVVKDVTSSDSTWFLGDFRKAFRYRWRKRMVVETRNDGETRWTRDIVFEAKVSEVGEPYAHDPRYVVKCTQ